MKSYRLLIAALVFFLIGTASSWGAEDASLSITGLVKQPLFLSIRELHHFAPVVVEHTEIAKDRGPSENYAYQGVTLRSLLEVAGIQKAGADFPKLVDLAIVARTADGRKAVFSWGEVFLRNPDGVVLGLTAWPAVARKKPASLQGAGEEALPGILSPIRFPKLVAVNDIYNERCLEGVVSITVVGLAPALPWKKTEGVTAEECAIAGAVKKAISLRELDGYPHREVLVKHGGEDKGVQGPKRYEGVALSALLKDAVDGGDAGTALVLSSPDGYRSVVSYGELFLAPTGERMLVADSSEGKPITSQGKFRFFCPDDVAPGREVKALNRIEVVKVRSAPKLSIVGVGCAESTLLTLEALSCIGEAGALICTDDVAQRFADYLGDKPVLFDQTKYMKHLFTKQHPELSPKAAQKALETEWDKAGEKLRAALNRGQDVAFLDYGDPTIFGTCWQWLKRYVKEDEIEFVPGISAFNASNALLRQDVTSQGSAVISSVEGLKKNESLLKAVAEKGETLGIFMGLKDLEGLAALLSTYYPASAPVKIVYRAGYPEKEKVVDTTLEKLVETAAEEPEKYLAVIYLGQALK